MRRYRCGLGVGNPECSSLRTVAWSSRSRKPRNGVVAGACDARLCYIRRVQLPARRDALAQRNRLDEIDEARQYALESPAERLSFALQSSELVRQLAMAVGNQNGAADLDQKSAQYVMPLSRLVR
jgi:hypothetical protein